LTFAEFVKNLVIVYDSLTDLSDLSLLLQKTGMRITEADKTILESIASSPGSHAEKVTEAVEKNTF
jgi:hypothetical protein